MFPYLLPHVFLFYEISSDLPRASIMCEFGSQLPSLQTSSSESSNITCMPESHQASRDQATKLAGTDSWTQDVSYITTNAVATEPSHYPDIHEHL